MSKKKTPDPISAGWKRAFAKVRSTTPRARPIYQLSAEPDETIERILDEEKESPQEIAARKAWEKERRLDARRVATDTTIENRAIVWFLRYLADRLTGPISPAELRTLAATREAMDVHDKQYWPRASKRLNQQKTTEKRRQKSGALRENLRLLRNKWGATFDFAGEVETFMAETWKELDRVGKGDEPANRQRRINEMLRRLGFSPRQNAEWAKIKTKTQGRPEPMKVRSRSNKKTRV